MKIGDILKNELLIGSIILMVLINFGNFINYLFHFLMARTLGPEDYGVLAVLTNLIYIFSVPTLSIQAIVARKTAELNSTKSYGKIKGVFNSLLKNVFFISLIFYLIFAVISIFLSRSLEINYLLFLVTGLMIFLSFISPLFIGIFQGTKKFKTWGFNYILSCALKLFIALSLVLIGFKVYGAILGFVIGSFFTIVFSFPFLKEIFLAKKENEKINLFYEDNLVAIFSILIIVLIFSSDVILAKMFFSEEVAGQYAVISLIGKIIFFTTSAVINAMFPITSENGKNKEKSQSVGKKAFFGVFLISVVSVGFMILFPELIIQVLFGQQYLGFSNLLIYSGITFSLLSFLNLLIYYKISVNRLKKGYLILLFLMFIIQIMVLFNFNNSLESFMFSYMVTSAIIFIISYLVFRK